MQDEMRIAEAVRRAHEAEAELERSEARCEQAIDALREWRDLADLPGGGFGGTLKQRTDEIIGRVKP